MKKRIFLLILLTFTITGCTNLSNKDLGELTDTMLENNNNLVNNVFDGYKYYVPKGLKLISKDDYNATFLDEYNNRYYFYIDVISYYNKENLDYTVNKKAYLSKKISNSNKEGYLEITKTNDNKYYFIQYMYNYGKVEVFVKENALRSAIINISSILKSLQFNRNVLETIIGNKVLDYKEDTYNVMKPKGSTATNDTYLEYEERYGIYEGYDIDSNEEKIEIEEN